MSERVIVRQNHHFEIDFFAKNPRDPEDEGFHEITHVHFLTPYGLLLSGLGACTSVILHSYAQNHGIALDEVTIDLTYDRVFAEDCEECEDIEEYKETIHDKIELSGDLTESERNRLRSVAHHCPIQKMLDQGIDVSSEFVDSVEVPGAIEQ